jgi:glycerophosphoryl diester phosphodiesterase
VQNAPLIVSHRGRADHDLPENTIEACELALAQGANALEVDIRFCASGELVVFHDITLKRVSGRPGMLISSTLADIKNIPLLINDLQKKIYIPTLREFINHFKNTVPINLEAKVFTPLAGQFAKYIVRAIKASGCREQFWVSSFNPVFLRTVKYCGWDIKTGYLFKKFGVLKKTFERLWFADFWQPEINVVNDKFIQTAQRINKDVYIWTVNDNPDIHRILKYPNLKGIITDFPQKVKNIIEQNLNNLK